MRTYDAHGSTVCFVTELASCKLCDQDHRRGSDECPARRVGKTVAGKYDIVQLLGVGGMGAVYRARHRTLGTEVALKMVHAKFAANPEIATRFEREAQHAASLRHPGIVVVSDLGRDTDGTPYLEMELLAGRSVDDIVRAGDMTTTRAIDLAIQALDALTFAHTKGFIHRDIKPENLFVTTTADGKDQLKVVDFGIAKALGDHSMTRTGSLMGTPLYMSPEQLTDSKNVTASSDVYSMGAALFEMLTGVPPIRAETFPEVVSKVLAGDFRREPSTLKGDLPPALDPILRRSLARDVVDRYPSAREMRDALASTPVFDAPRKADPGLVATLAPNAPSIASLPAVAATVAATEIPRTVSPVTPTPMTPVSIADAPGRSKLVVPALVGIVVVGGIVAVLATRSSSPAVDKVSRDAAPVDTMIAVDTAIDAALEVSEGMVSIAGGTFEMGSTTTEIDAAFKLCRDVAGAAKGDCSRKIYEREQPKRTVRVSPFFLDRTEVTNASLVEWLSRQEVDVRDRNVVAKDGALLLDLHPDHAGFVRKGSRWVAVDDRGQRPAVQITWLAAKRYCTDQGKRLPTEAEWELAARGTGRQPFPSGPYPPACDQVAFARGAGMICVGFGFGASLKSQASDVGSFPEDRTPAGVMDLGGNVAEWVEDAFVAPYAACAGDCLDPIVSRPDTKVIERVYRGGYWDGHVEAVRGAGRSRAKSDQMLNNVGFRCAKARR
ncbi:MAG: SUMF1/EgtB/PvdO family nonheme iron enzyme [Deltaproteobacteria bacterium]|nr:SUMF1/EgtB/PvdO family nonheme iron enzyme [Deltaproteobacteria bacterium]